MNTDDFSKFLSKKGKEVTSYMQTQFPQKAGEISLRFIDNNFKMQGWQGNNFQPWKPNKKGTTILIKTGLLRRGNYFTKQPGVAHIKNNVKYAALHNDGYKGMVTIKSHQRTILAHTKIGTGKTYIGGKKQMQTIASVAGIQNVKEHQRNINIPKRKFFPTRWHDSPVLVNSLRNQVITDLKKIMH